MYCIVLCCVDTAAMNKTNIIKSSSPYCIVFFNWRNEYSQRCYRFTVRVGDQIQHIWFYSYERTYVKQCNSNVWAVLQFVILEGQGRITLFYSEIQCRLVCIVHKFAVIHYLFRLYLPNITPVFSLMKFCRHDEKNMVFL